MSWMKDHQRQTKLVNSIHPKVETGFHKLRSKKKKQKKQKLYKSQNFILFNRQFKHNLVLNRFSIFSIYSFYFMS